jgi:activator of HSP90 ATPase
LASISKLGRFTDNHKKDYTKRLRLVDFNSPIFKFSNYVPMKNYKKHFSIKALPEDVYAAFTNQEIVTIWTGEEAIMPLEPNAEFSWWGGDICGKNIDFESNKKLVQQWYFDDDETDTPSEVTLKFHADKKGMQLEVNQTNIPDEAYKNIAEGWEEIIVASIRDLLEE